MTLGNAVRVAGLLAIAPATVSAWGAPQKAFIPWQPIADGSGPSLQIWNCSDDPKIRPNQIWTHNATTNALQLVSNGLCMDVQDYNIADESTIWTYTCHPEDKNPAHQNQAWSINANGTITELMSGSCVDVSAYGVTPGQQVWLYHCTGAQNQQWQIVQESDGFRIVGVQSGLCLDAGTSFNPCDDATFASMPFCNTSLPIDDRVANMIQNMPDTEKWGLFNTQSTGIGTLGVAVYQWWSEALHGVAYSPGVSFGSQIPGATSFPTVATSAMSFNRTLWNSIGSVISTEARAMANQKQAGLTFWAPNINIFRDPRWGRGQETPGEDPYLTSQYVVQFVKGMQEGEDPRYLKVSSCCKHYAAYSLENWEGVDRHHFNAIVTAQDEVDTYLPAFGACVQEGRVSGIMCSYNEVNGIPSCANSFLLTEIARNSWGFDGYVTSDCGAITDIIDTHHYTNTSDATVAVSLQAGTDIGCDSYIPPALPQAVTDGAVTIDQVDTAIAHLLRVRMRLGVFDPSASQPYLQIPPSAVCTPENQALALDGALQGMTLLKNNANMTGLPLSSTTVKRLAVIGPNAQATTTLQGNYYGSPCGNIVSPLDALGAFATTNYTQGAAIASNDTSGFAAAVGLAAACDATVLIVGIDQSQESEGNDREIIAFPGVQNALIQQVCAASRGPCIVVVIAGGALDISAQLADPNVDSILWTGYPGEAGGVAIAQTLFGVNVPAGRLVQTLYPANFINQISMFEMNMRPGPSAFPPGSSPGRTYRFYTGQTVVPFGYGLSYTTFAYGIASAPTTVSMQATHEFLARHAEHGAAYAPTTSPIAADYWVNVTNTGTRDADDVVIGFLTPPGAGQNGVPLKYVYGFQRVHVPAGQTVTVWLGLTARDLTQVDGNGRRVAWPGAYTISFGVEDAMQHGMGYVEHRFTSHCPLHRTRTCGSGRSCQ